MKKSERNAHSLRDMLFDEIKELKSSKSNPKKSQAVANIAKQIINVSKLELDFYNTMVNHKKSGIPLELGNLKLGN